MGRDRVRCVALLYCLVSSRRAERLEALKAIGEEGLDRHKLIAMIVAALMPQELAEKKRAMADGRDNINGTSMMREGEFGRVNAANTGRSYGFDKAADAIQWLMPSLAKRRPPRANTNVKLNCSIASHSPTSTATTPWRRSLRSKIKRWVNADVWRCVQSCWRRGK